MRKLKSLPHDHEKTCELEMMVFEYEEDLFENLKLSNLMRKLQEVASYDVLELGYNHEQILQLGYVHVLLWSSIEMVRDIRVGEKLRFLTSPREAKGSKMYRDIWVEDLSGERIVEASTVWTSIDPVNRKIVDPGDSPIPYRFQEKNIQIEDARKIRPRKEMPFLGERIVRFSDMDVNRHMNNCQYADLFCDYIGIDFENYQIGCFKINYRKEIYMGDKIDLYGEFEETEKGLQAHMMGKVEENICFLIEAELFLIDRKK